MLVLIEIQVIRKATEDYGVVMRTMPKRVDYVGR